MKVFLFIISIFIGILTYNLYVPTLTEIEEIRKLYYATWENLLLDYRIYGTLFGVITMALSCIGLINLYQHFEWRERYARWKAEQGSEK